jgi:type IV secretion system protein VirD4
MTPTRIIMLVAPGLLMLGALLGLTGIEQWTASFGTTPDVRVLLGRAGIALPYLIAAAIGIVFLFGARGAVSIRTMGGGVLIGTVTVVVVAAVREGKRLSSFADSVPAGASLMSYVDPATSIGATLAAVAGVFALRVAMRGDAAFASAAPRRIHGKRSIHGDAEWMAVKDARRLFPEAGGIVVGEAYRVDKDTVAERGFRADDRDTWGTGGRSPLLCFDASFGSTHGLVFAGSGGFKTTSVTVPTALKWGGSLVALDPSNEVAPMVVEHRRQAGRDVFILDPRDPSTGFNVLDWIGRFGGTK